MTTSEHEKIELSEQTPLKSDTDAPATTNDAPSAAEIVAGAEGNTADAGKGGKKGGLKGLFHLGKGHKQQKVEESAEKAAEEETEKDKEKEKEKEQEAEAKTAEKAKKKEEKEKEAEEKKKAPKEKKQFWWNKNCQKYCSETQNHSDGQDGQQQQLTYGVNLVQRDDHGLHTTVDFTYEDIYGEPDSTHSLAGVWKANHCVFVGVRSIFYKIFSLIIALPLAIVFGVLFALASVLSVFVCVPAGRLVSIPANYLFKAWNYVVSSVFDPVFHAIGQCFTNVRISRYGINSDPTTVLTA